MAASPNDFWSLFGDIPTRDAKTEALLQIIYGAVPGQSAQNGTDRPVTRIARNQGTTTRHVIRRSANPHEPPYNFPPQPVQPAQPAQNQKPAAYNVSSDPVTEHYGQEHATLTPYSQQPGLGTGERSYGIGVRPLDNVPQLFLEDKWARKAPHLEHMQLIDNWGNNFGLTGWGGYRKGGYILEERDERLPEYSLMAPRYNADLIDEARKRVEAEWEEKRTRASFDPSFGGMGIEPQRYSLFTNNCQDYVRDVIRVARDLAGARQIQLFKK